MPVKFYCVIAKPSRSAGTRVPKWKAIIMGSDGPHGSYGKKVSNRQIFIVGYLQFEEREHLHTALCSTGCGVSAVVRKLHRVLYCSP